MVHTHLFPHHGYQMAMILTFPRLRWSEDEYLHRGGVSGEVLRGTLMHSVRPPDGFQDIPLGLPACLGIRSFPP